MYLFFLCCAVIIVSDNSFMSIQFDHINIQHLT
uniref:Uncharacterized protein n=1 Tax=Rhizophora mucronata TaxID=61149 RepID=A0A2P2PB69_RHIMU